MSDLTTLDRTAASQFGVLTTNQLAGAGFNRSDVTRLVRGGELRLVRRGIHAVVALGPPRWEQKAWAAIERCGPAAVLSHRSAARLHGFRPFDDVDLSVAYPADAKLADVFVHRARDLHPGHHTSVLGLPVTTPARTLCDLGLVLPSREVERLVDHAISAGRVGVGDLLDVRTAVGAQGRNGVGAIDEALRGMPELATDAESGPELQLWKLIGRFAWLPDPVPQYPLTVRGRHYRIDLAFPEHRVALEYDGQEWHSSDRQRSADRRRQAEIESIGWSVERFTKVDLANLAIPATLQRIRRALEAAKPQPRSDL